jgi:hypothetical protein
MIKPAPKNPPAQIKSVTACPYCASSDILKKRKRRKKYEVVQLYRCKRCRRRFTPLVSKHRTYPLKVILGALTLYNRFYSLEDVAAVIRSSLVALPTNAYLSATFRGSSHLSRISKIRLPTTDVPIQADTPNKTELKMDIDLPILHRNLTNL